MEDDYIYIYDLLIYVFVKVASSNLTNLFKLKLSHKNFCGLEDDYIFWLVTLKGLSLVCCTSDEILLFLKQCKENENQVLSYMPSRNIYDLLMKIFVKVASTSLSDLFKLKLSCKDFCRLVDDYVFSTCIVERTSLIWCKSDEVMSFLNAASRAET